MLNPVRRFLCWIGADPIATGTVVEMRHYVAQPTTVPKPVMINGTEANETTAIAAEESWSLSVRGLDRFGEVITEEIFVDPLTWNNTKIGDIYRR